jgi:hypothetical protein
MPQDEPLPFYQPPTAQEKLQLLADLPHGARKGYRQHRPLDIGLWDEVALNQLDMLHLMKGGK